MRSSSSSYRIPPRASKKIDQFALGPVIYQDTTDPASKTSRNKSFTDQSPTPSGVESLSFRSPDTSSKSSKKSKKSNLKKKTGKATPKKTKKSKRESQSDKSDEEVIKQEIRDQDMKREKSSYKKKKRDKILKLGKKAEKEHKKLMLQRNLTQQATKEIESSMNIEQETRTRSMDTMKNQLDGLDWRTNRDLKDVRREIKDWKEKTAMSGNLAKRVDNIEKRVDVLEKTDAERKKTIELVEKNWSDFGRLKTQSMALELTQIKNRRGAAHLVKMPDDLAKTTAKNLYKLCADLHRFTFHVNQKNEVARLADEALTLAEAIAPLYGPKDDFIDSRETTSSTIVSISGGESSSRSGSAPTSPAKESARKPSRPEVGLPPLIKFDPKYSMRTNQWVDAPSLREKSSNYYSDNELTKQTQSNSELVPVVLQAVTTVIPPAPAPTVAVASTVPAATVETAPAAAPSAASELPTAPAPTEVPSVPPPTGEATPTPPPPTVDAPSTVVVAAPSDGPSPASISLSVDSDRETIVKKKKSGSRRSSKESKVEEKPE